MENDMPYSIVKRNDQWCLVRDASEARPQRTVGCHDTKNKAEKQREAIEANTNE